MALLNEFRQRDVRLHGGARKKMKNCAKKSTGRCVFLLNQKSTEEMHRLKPRIMAGRNPLRNGWLEGRKPEQENRETFAAIDEGDVRANRAASCMSLNDVYQQLPKRGIM